MRQFNVGDLVRYKPEYLKVLGMGRGILSRSTARVVSQSALYGYVIVTWTVDNAKDGKTRVPVRHLEHVYDR